MTFPPPSLLPIAQEVVTLLQKRKETLQLGETASGGLLASTILSLPGTSGCFKSGMIAYGLESRTVWLDWTDEDTKNYDGPSLPLIRRLAHTLHHKLPTTTYTLFESAISGPSLPSRYRPSLQVGYCPISIVGSEAGEDKVWWEWEGVVRCEGERGDRMVEFAKEGLEGLREVLRKREEQEGAGGGKL